MNQAVRVAAVVTAGILCVLVIPSLFDSNDTGNAVSVQTATLSQTEPSHMVKSCVGVFTNGTLSISSILPILLVAATTVLLTAIIVIFMIQTRSLNEQNNTRYMKEEHEIIAETEEYSEEKPKGTLTLIVKVSILVSALFLSVIVTYSLRSKFSAVTSRAGQPSLLAPDVNDHNPANVTTAANKDSETETAAKIDAVEIKKTAKETKSSTVCEDTITVTPDVTIIKGAKDSYQIGQYIGSGWVATAYLATRLSDGHRFAVKTSERENVLKNEAHILSQFDQENIVHFVERVGSVNVYEYIDGGVLEDLMESSVSDEELSAIAAQLLKAIAALQEKHIVHRDIHLKNVMVNSGGVIKLIDFDWAVKESQAKVFKERGEHMAPEIYRNEVATCKADVWSVGYCVGRFRGNPRHGIGVGERGHAPPNLHGFKHSPLLHDFLTHALETDHKKRWSARQLLEHDFVRLSAGREHALVKQVISRKK